MGTKNIQQVYWHHELPPLDLEAVGEQVVEATSQRVPGTLEHRDEMWTKCYEDLMARARNRILQEVYRLGGTRAHVLSESIDTKHDGASGEAWLHGSFTCFIYREPSRLRHSTSKMNEDAFQCMMTNQR